MIDRRTAKRSNSQRNDIDLTPPTYVVLGMVRLGARSGYEIKQTVELSIRFFWTISQAQIYPSLERLEQAGLIVGNADPQGQRPRRAYEITAAGEAALRAWLSRDEPMPFELRDIALVKLFFADALDHQEAVRLLRATRQRSEERVAALKAVEPTGRDAAEEGNVYPLLTLQMGVAFHEAMIDVCQTFERRFRHHRPNPPRTARSASPQGRGKNGGRPTARMREPQRDRP
jgi:PadR family transcriptional regulator AphA